MVAGDATRQIIVLAQAGERNPDLSCEGLVENFRERV